jgi:pilus assembly protein TadC
MMLYLVFALIIASVCLIALGIFPSTRLRLRPSLTGEFWGLPVQRQLPNFFVSGFPAVFKKASVFINRPFLKLSYINSLQEKLDFLKLPFGALEVFLLKELLLVGLGILVAIAVSASFAWIAGLVGFFLPDIIINSKVRSRKDAIVKFLPETVDLIDLCIGAGLDFLSALRWILKNSLSNPFIEELATVMHEIQVGRSRSEALKAMADRLRLPDISSFSRTIILAERMGISMEEALKNLAQDTRDNRFQKGERFAIKASLKILFPLLFFILPVIMIVVAGPIIIKFTQGSLIPATSSGF